MFEVIASANTFYLQLTFEKEADKSVAVVSVAKAMAADDDRKASSSTSSAAVVVSVTQNDDGKWRLRSASKKEKLPETETAEMRTENGIAVSDSK